LEILKGRDHLREGSIDGKIILTGLKEIGCEDVDCIQLVQDKVQ
jgi:hypothetical protein